MRSSQPPRVATWLLKRLTAKGKNEALVGDLLEDFTQRRSAAWYWRQVLAAIFANLVQQLRSRGTPVRSAGIRFMFLLVALSIPMLLPKFASHRVSWLLLLLVVAAFSSLLAVPFRRLTERLAASRTTEAENRIVRAFVGLMLCCLAAGVLFHYVALPSDSVFIAVAIPTLLALWFALHYWRILFIALANKLRWTTSTCTVIGNCIFAVGLILQHFLNRHQGNLALLVCSLAALGSFRTRLPGKTQIHQ